MILSSILITHLIQYNCMVHSFENRGIPGILGILRGGVQGSERVSRVRLILNLKLAFHPFK